jgi:hypothetical protein
MSDDTPDGTVTRYAATVNVPGYLPMADEPAVFETAADAWRYLADECRRGEDWATEIDESDPDELPYSDTVAELDRLAQVTGANALGTVYGDTPGYDGRHDLGLAYSVSETEMDYCDRCGASLDNGEGYDGLCGNCADRAYAERVDAFSRVLSATR